MPVDLVTLGIVLVAAGGSGLLSGLLVWFYHRMKRLERENSDYALLADRLDELRAQLQDTREEMGSLHERVDFSERVLAQVHQEARLPAPEPGRGDTA